MKITVEQFKALFPQNKNPQPIVDVLNLLLPKYGIDTKEEICAYLAECGVESNGFTTMIENLNYSGEGLLKTFPKYFNKTNYAPYIRNPAKIANRVYANRMGNGDEASNEGFLYRGRGAVQITGKLNYSLFAVSIGKTLPETVEYASGLEGGICSSLWFWKSNNLDKYDDLKSDFITLTKKINGGTNGIIERQKFYDLAISIIK